MPPLNPPLPPVSTAPSRELTTREQADMVVALQASLQARHRGLDVLLIETHISFVIVAGAFAYKIKKAIAPGFLDFTTLARREHYCLEELRLNRRLAAALYLDVIPVTGPVDTPVLGGDGPPIDFAVRMRAFAQDGLWDRIAARGELGPAHIDALVRLVSDFHRQAAVADEDHAVGSPAQVRAPMLDNLVELRRLLTDGSDDSSLEALAHWEAAAFGALEAAFAERRRSGRIRECHGDLHLGNVVQIDGRTTVFDCIEFNDEFRWIDVMSELAFMVMDLHSHGRPDLANRFVNGCLERSGDYAGVRVLRYYLVHRALVRAKVAGLRAVQARPPQGLEAARHYLGLAVAASRPPEVALMITHGPSGSGKTTLTQGLLEAAGAIRVRADVERKRLFGLDALAHSAAAMKPVLYSAEASEATYAKLLAAAAAVLDGGFSVILDATFLQRRHREQARALAAAHGRRFVILDFEVDAETLRARVLQRAARGDDASEADLPVLESQLRAAEALAADERSAVFRVRHGPGLASGEARADWSALLRTL